MSAQCLAELFASDGTTLLDFDATGLVPGGAIIEYLVPADGSFFVRLTNALGLSGVGTNYDLRIYKPTGPCGPSGGKVHVSVRSGASGLPLSGIKVVLTGFGTAPKTRTTTAAGTADFLGLENQTYTVSITEPGYTVAINPSLMVVTCGSTYSVTATLTPVVVPPVLQVTPTEEESGPQDNNKTYQITNAGGGTLNWTAQVTQGAGWLSFSGASSGTNNGPFTVQYGKNETTTTRKGYVKITAPGADGSGVEVVVQQKGGTTPPVVTVLGPPSVTVYENDPYTDAGATATDAVSGNVTGTLTTTNPVNTAIPVTYFVTYRATDVAGNIGSAQRTVTVIPDLPPGVPVNPIWLIAAILLTAIAAVFRMIGVRSWNKHTSNCSGDKDG